jgi:uncharacterized repeat protein (TIGR03843 family)
VSEREITQGEAVELLEEGELDVLGRMPWSSNQTYLARLEHRGVEALAIYKPRRGERPLWDFPPGTLCRREVAAFAVSEALEWSIVPLTVLRDGPLGEGMVQLFVDHDPEQHYFTLREQFSGRFRQFALFDVVTNNADRKSGHCLLGADGVIHVIDHGVCFSTVPTLRTVIWEFAGEPVPDDVRAGAERLARDLRGGPLRAELLVLLDSEEVDATAARAESLARTGRFPHPGPGRPYPWPAV